MKAQSILFYFALVLVTVSVAGDDKDDVKFDGSYDLVTDPDNDNMGDYLKAMGFTEEGQKEVRANKKVLIIIKKLNKTSCSVKTQSKGKTREMIFTSGEEFEARIADGRKVMNTITVDKEEKTAMRVIKMEGFEATNEAKFCKGGFNVTLKAKEAVADLRFKRVSEGEAEFSKGAAKMEEAAKKFFG